MESDVKTRIKAQENFRWNNLSGRITNADDEDSISTGYLTGTAEDFYLVECEHDTVEYTVYSGPTPILWYGAFYWMMPPRDLISEIDDKDYLFCLEVFNELDEDNNEPSYRRN